MRHSNSINCFKSGFHTNIEVKHLMHMQCILPSLQFLIEYFSVASFISYKKPSKNRLQKNKSIYFSLSFFRYRANFGLTRNRLFLNLKKLTQESVTNFHFQIIILASPLFF